MRPFEGTFVDRVQVMDGLPRAAAPRESLGNRAQPAVLRGLYTEIMVEVCPLTDGSQDRGELLARARVAIAEQDQPSALQLLRELAEGDRRSDESLAPAVGDALVAIARGARQDDADRVALARLKSIEHTREQVIQLLERTPFSSADLAAIRDVCSALEASARQAEEEAFSENSAGDQATSGHRVGSVWLEMKYIPDAASGKLYGPYIYLDPVRQEALGKISGPWDGSAWLELGRRRCRGWSAASGARVSGA